jgi:hypothetical protein
MTRKYHDVLSVSKEAAASAFESGDPEKICWALLAIAFHETDWRWAQDKCLDFLLSDNPEVSGLAATCLGHIARIHRSLDRDKVIAALRARLSDKDIRGQVEDALDDIEMFG